MTIVFLFAKLKTQSIHKQWIPGSGIYLKSSNHEKTKSDIYMHGVQNIITLL